MEKQRRASAIIVISSADDVRPMVMIVSDVAVVSTVVVTAVVIVVIIAVAIVTITGAVTVATDASFDDECGSATVKCRVNFTFFR